MHEIRTLRTVLEMEPLRLSKVKERSRPSELLDNVIWTIDSVRKVL